MPDPVERTLKDISGGDMVDHLGATLSGRIRLQERAFGRDGRKTLIPEGDGKLRQPLEVAGEGAGGLAARALRPVHVARQAEDGAAGPPLAAEVEEGGRIGGELRPPDRQDRRGDREERVRDRDADGLRAEVEPGQCPGTGQGGGEVLDPLEDHSATPAWAAAARITAS